MKKIAQLLILTVFGALSSCSSDYVVRPSVENIILTADSSTKLIGQTMTFSVTNAAGDDLTADATFYVDGAAITGNTLTGEQIGTHTVTAHYFSVVSDPLSVSFHDGSEVLFLKRLLIEDYTGTWCGYCPRVAYATDLVHNLTDNFVPVSIHRASSNPADASYDPYNYDTTVLENLINVPGYPKGMLNRTTQWTYPEPNHIDQAIAFTQGSNPKLGLAMDAEVNSGTINLTVKATFAQDFTGLKLVVYVLENGLVYDQHNYTTYFGGTDPIPSYTHNHVLRAPLTDLLGDAVGDSQTHLADTYTRNFSVPVPANVENPANVEFVAFLLAPDNSVINVRKAQPGDHQDFEEL